jgi:hypothetical protein
MGFLLLLGLIALVIMFVMNPVQAFKGVVGAGIAGIVLVPFLGPVGERWSPKLGQVYKVEPRQTEGSCPRAREIVTRRNSRPR